MRRPASWRAFAVHPKRSMVERTFAWLTACRCLARDYEPPAVSERSSGGPRSPPDRPPDVPGPTPTPKDISPSPDAHLEHAVSGSDELLDERQGRHTYCADLVEGHSGLRGKRGAVCLLHENGSPILIRLGRRLPCRQMRQPSPAHGWGMVRESFLTLAVHVPEPRAFRASAIASGHSAGR